ncbi:GNAT family protein [Hymenobacter sp.]|jgi:ribosomal-protein-alanine N-acetyltransferase/ribosomal-protein-serine acetyltransferase|uniref:GNAT family N-acetyltransferase n=1 Tax=Hymenobacter sp. TaxID=1898978 RepID=UPI002ED94C11
MIETQRLLLRPWQPQDRHTLLDLLDANRPRLTIDFPQTLAAVRDAATAANFIEEKIREWHTRAGYQFGIWETATRQCVGLFSFKNIDWSVPKAEVAYMLAAEAEGRGLMLEAAQAGLAWGFERLDLERVYCSARLTNLRSGALAGRLGFEREGVLRQVFRGGDGKLYDSAIYGLLRSEFVALPGETA